MAAGWNESQLRKYNIKLEKIPTLQYDDPKVDFFLSKNVSITHISPVLCNIIFCEVHTTHELELIIQTLCNLHQG